MSVLTLETAKGWLSIPLDSAQVDDDKLQSTIDAAERALAHRVGPLAREQRTVTRSSVGGAVLLPITPSEPITTASNPWSGETLAAGDLFVEHGVVRRAYGDALAAGPWSLTFYVGWATEDDLPADLLMAVKEMVRHLWSPTRPRGGKSGAGSTPAASGTAHLLPWRVQELIEPFLLLDFA